MSSDEFVFASSEFPPPFSIAIGVVGAQKVGAAEKCLGFLGHAHSPPGDTLQQGTPRD